MSEPSSNRRRLVVRRKPPDIPKDSVERRLPRAIGAYIFAGLFTVGVREHFEVLAHLEDGPFGCATARRNFPGLQVHEDPDSWPLEDLRRSGVDFVYANPPCAPWSNANGKGGNLWRSDPRTSCVARTFDLLRKLRPKVWTFESVRGAYTKGREMVDEMAAEAAELGYSTTHLFVDANNHGVAQVRKRYFMVCHRVEVKFPPPGVPSATVGAALRNIEPGDEYVRINPKHLHIAKALRPGERFRDAFDRMSGAVQPRNEKGHVKGRPSYLMVRLHPDLPSSVLTGSATKIHPREHRFISIEESKALCGLPRSFKFEGSTSSKYAQAAKAVMPPVGEYVARCAAHAVKTNFRVTSPSVRQVVVHRDLVEITKMPVPALGGGEP